MLRTDYADLTLPYDGLRNYMLRDAKGYARWTQQIKHVNFFRVLSALTRDAESTHFVRKSTEHYTNERHAYTIVRYPTPIRRSSKSIKRPPRSYLRTYTYPLRQANVTVRQSTHNLSRDYTEATFFQDYAT